MPSTLSFLSEIDEPYLQGSVASNIKTPKATLISLYKKSKTIQHASLIQWGLASNENTPTYILKELSLSSNSYTKLDAEQTLKAMQP